MDSSDIKTTLAEIVSRLNTIETTLNNDVVTTKSLLTELISKLNTQPSTYKPQNTDKNRPVYFHVTKFVDTDDNDFVHTFSVSGRTYDYRNTLKEFGTCKWDNNAKSWVFDYNDDLYEQVLNFLKEHSEDIKFFTKTYVEENEEEKSEL